MKTILGLVLVLSATSAFAACPPDGRSKDSLLALKALKFTVQDAAEKKTLAEGLVDCVGDPDPAIRDGVAYEALSAWMRAGDFDADTLRGLRDALYAQLDGAADDGFRRPFAALVLSEVARTDRVAPWMAPDERAAMVGRAAAYVEAIDDYRGFDDREGWRHGVAHGADWLMQLALNPALDRVQADRILAAVAAQAVPASAHAYVFGEGGRLARPVIQLAKRGLYSEAEWTVWFATLPQKIGDADKAYNDVAWLARRHDLMAFLMSLYLEADQSDDAQIKALKPAIVATLKTVP